MRNLKGTRKQVEANNERLERLAQALTEVEGRVEKLKTTNAELLAALEVCRAWLETTAFPSDNQELRDSAASLLVVTVEPAIEKHKP